MFALASLAMLAAIDLDHQAARVADEIEIVSLEWRLVPDVEAAFAQELQAAPEDDLGLTHVVAEIAGAMDFREHARMLFRLCSNSKAEIATAELDRRFPTLLAHGELSLPSREGN